MSERAKRKPSMRVGVEDKAREEPKRVVPHDGALYTPCALDRLLLLLGGGFDEAAAIEAASAALGVRVSRSDLEDRRGRVAEWQARLRELLRDPGIEQRTPAWYEARGAMVTASDIAQALGCAKFGTQRTFFQKKCGLAEEQSQFNASLPPLKWGVMYEPVAQAVYSAANLGVRVHEFGLLRHPTLGFIGASPDGITEQGIMLEIKCPWRRKIVEGELPNQYYYQIQAQLAVCGLQECDYFECELFEPACGPEDEEWTCPRRAAAKERGVFLELGEEEAGAPQFVYPTELGIAGGDADALREWVDAETASAAEKGLAARPHWWALRKRATIRVAYDQAFCDDMFARLANVWERVVTYRGDRDLYLSEVGAALTAPPKTPDLATLVRTKPTEYMFIEIEED